jgi:hypothetical protein
MGEALHHRHHAVVLISVCDGADGSFLTEDTEQSICGRFSCTRGAGDDGLFFQ